MAHTDEKTGTSSPGITAATLSDQELGYASQASHEFSKNNFDSCLVILNKLKTTRNFDVKIATNYAVADYYQSGLTKTEQFKSNIQELRSKVTSDESANALEDDYCYVHYNCAVIHYHTRQYTLAIGILEKLWNSKDNLDENLLGKVVCLLVDLYIVTYQPYKSLSLMDIFDDIKSKSCGGFNLESTDKYALIWAQQRLRCYVMINSMEQAKKEVKLLNQNTASTQILKANFELMKQNHKKSINLLNSCMSSHKKNEHMNLTCYNNIGVNYFNLQKFHLAHLHFAKAFEEGSYMWKSPGSQTGQSLESLSNKKHFELLYNMGVNLLHCGQPEAAFDYLLNVVQVYQFNPRLWLRLAECCTRVYKQKNNDECDLMKKEYHFIGTSVHRKRVLGPEVHCRRVSANDSGAIPVPTLEFASLCLENALNCLDNLSESVIVERESDEKSDASTKHLPLFISVAPSSPIREDEVNNLRCSILMLKSYVALCLKNCIVAFNAAESLLQLPYISGVQRYLGQMYKAQALMSMDKISEGISLLSHEEDVDPKIFGTVNSEGSQSDTEVEIKCPTELSQRKSLSIRDWYPYNDDQAKAIKLYNCAVLWTLKGDHPKAKLMLDQSIALHKWPLFAKMCYLGDHLDTESMYKIISKVL